MANNLSLFPTKDIKKFWFAWVYGSLFNRYINQVLRYEFIFYRQEMDISTPAVDSLKSLHAIRNKFQSPYDVVYKLRFQCFRVC